MARTTVRLPFHQPQPLLDQQVREVLIGDDYREIDYNREVVWKKGTGLMTAMHYIKIVYQENTLIISGWVQMGVGSVGGKEHALEGFVASIPKKSVLKTIDKLKAVVS